mgnify:CR=1 FL=1
MTRRRGDEALNPAATWQKLCLDSGQLLAERCEQGNHFRPIFPINQKIGIGGADGGTMVNFCQSRDAGVGKVHGRVEVAVHQASEGAQFIIESYQAKITLGDEIDDLSTGNAFFADKMADLGKHRFTSDSCRVDFTEGSERPFVVLIARAEPCN